jgi:hypothetical protein
VTERSNTKRILVTGLTLFGCLLIFFFGLRAVHAFRKFGGTPPPQRPSGEVETDVERIRDWMTVPFIARMYGVPEETLFEALEIPEEGNRKKSLEELEKKYYPNSKGTVIEIVKATILAHPPPPTPDSPPMPDAPPSPPLPPAP